MFDIGDPSIGFSVYADPAHHAESGPERPIPSRVTVSTIHLKAHAKINLALAVGPEIREGPEQGMHPIASWMHAIDLHDSIVLSRVGPDSPPAYDICWADGSAVGWESEADLIVRAHRALEAHAGPLPAAITARKHIPAGGGLGGGSSDAAAVLGGLVRLFGLTTDHAELVRIGHALGSDIPFFLDEAAGAGEPPRPALVTGLGDRVERLEPPLWDPHRVCLLVCPPFGCPTGEVYRAFDARSEPGVRRGGDVDRLARSPDFDPAALFNDLADPAESVRPGLRSIRRGLEERLGQPVHVSGSGSTLFTFVPAGLLDEATRAARSIEPGSIVMRTKPTYLQHSG